MISKGTSVQLFNYTITSSGLEKDVEYAYELIKLGGHGRYMACANPHSLVIAAQDPIFQRALQNADILVPDGIGIVIGARVLGLPLRERVAGYEFFVGLLRHCSEMGGLSVYFLGSTNLILERIADRTRRDFPLLRLCGKFSPPFKSEFSEEENSRMIEAINAANPAILWVGMTAPKQEKWIYQNRDRLNVPFIGAIGAVFDFYAGTKKRSSPMWQKLGLEWLPRFLREPQRLWERNLKSIPIFLSWIFRERMRQIFEA
jgi:N-acetylglucosaminyldiphosphoundecaprenol N-acetyl-beta-D-mannosaminyltransferase